MYEFENSPVSQKDVAPIKHYCPTEAIQPVHERSCMNMDYYAVGAVDLN